MIEYKLPGAQWANVDLVGEFAYERALLKVIGGRPRGTDPITVEDLRVELVPEPDNPYSKSGKAISARVDGKVIGYIAEDQAKLRALEFHRIAASGATAVTTGTITAYNKYNGEIEFRARVGIPDHGLVTPLNADSLPDVAVLPWGSSLQVTKEEDHLDHLSKYVPASGKGMVVLTMHKFEHHLKNGSIREIVEVRLDGERVGQLTPGSSAHFLPTMQHAKEAGIQLGIWSTLKGSGLAVELTIHGARATELSGQWLSTMPLFPELVPAAKRYDVPNAYTPSDSSKRKAKRPKPVERTIVIPASEPFIEIPQQVEDAPLLGAPLAPAVEQPAEELPTRRSRNQQPQRELTEFGAALFLGASILCHALAVVFVIVTFGLASDAGQLTGSVMLCVGLAICFWILGQKLWRMRG